jgi:hypothetical protein
MLKTRWRNIFNNALELEVQNCVKVVFSACVLHNVCLLGNYFDPKDLEEVPNESESNFSNAVEGEDLPRDSPEATVFRNQLLNTLLNENL